MNLSSPNLVCAMEVLEILSINVGWCDVGTAAKPPLAWNPIPFFSLKISAERMLL